MKADTAPSAAVCCAMSPMLENEVRRLGVLLAENSHTAPESSRLTATPFWMLSLSTYLYYALILVWFGLYICPTKPKPIYREAGQKKKVQMGVELGGSYMAAITQPMTILRNHAVSTPLGSRCVLYEGVISVKSSL